MEKQKLVDQIIDPNQNLQKQNIRAFLTQAANYLMLNLLYEGLTSRRISVRASRSTHLPLTEMRARCSTTETAVMSALDMYIAAHRLHTLPFPGLPPQGH